MATTTGVDSGFVASQPTDDPGGNNSVIDNTSQAVKGTSPATAGNIVEVGWYCSNATPEINYEMGLYNHNVGSDIPGNLLQVERTNAKGTSAGWKRVVVDWTIDPDTIYWIAVQVDNTSTTYTYLDAASGASRFAYEGSESTLLNPFPPPDATTTNAAPFYMLWTTGVTYSELSGTIAAQSSVSGNLELSTYIALSGMITATSTVGPSSLGSTAVGIDVATAYIKRLVTAGNNRFYYEAI